MVRSLVTGRISRSTIANGIGRTTLAGGCLQMDQARNELFLDEGWNVIGCLHQWLSKWPQASNDQPCIDSLIGSLQAMWAAADDFGLKRLARTSLALEQMLERYG